MVEDISKKSEAILSIEEAIAILRKNIPERVVVQCRVQDCFGKYLSEDVRAPEPSPRFDNSAMDGFGVRWQDVKNATKAAPVALKIVGESQAGIEFNGEVGPAEAVRISTGALLAGGCDTVIRVEDTEEAGDQVIVKEVRRCGQDVRYQGEEFDKDEILLREGTRISAPQMALLTSVGIDSIKVYKPCDVALLVTGSELVSEGEKIARYKIRDSNMIMLRAAVEGTGAQVSSSLLVLDDEKATEDAIKGISADVIICTGGISVGRHDHVKEAASRNGFKPLFWRIRQKPGKPLYFAKNGNRLLFGLPGNPVSAFMCYTHYVRPLLSTLNGLPFGWPTVTGEALADIVNKGKRTNMIRVQLTWRPHGGYCITDAIRQGSHMLTSLSESDGYIILEPGQVLKEGDRIDVYRYDSLREPV